MKDYAGQTVWLIGASSGIGRALAFELDRRGARMALSARRAEELDSLNRDMQSRHFCFPCDVTDSAALEEAVAGIAEKFSTLDCVLFFAGTYEQMKFSSLDMDKAQKIVQTNFTGALNLVHAALPVLLAQKKGQLALCASVAGYRGLPNAQPYGATKAALINLAESLRAETLSKGIDIRVINPGFVRTPMTDKNSFPMPMMIEADTAARAIADGLKTRQFEIHFPRRFTWIMKFLKIIPDFIYFRIVAQ